ncbi:MAG: glycosyltransferase family 2 protein [Chloroflexota bacterium]
MSNELTVVIPIYNEAAVLPQLLPKIISYCRERRWALILVNDGSNDETKSILGKIPDEPDVRVFHHKVNRGYGRALKTGLEQTRTPYVVTMDGDGQHSLTDIDNLFEVILRHDADIVVGSRQALRLPNKYRQDGKRLVRVFARMLMPISVHDLNSGFKLYRTELVQRYLYLCPDSMAFSDIITLVFINRGNLVIEHPISINPRLGGRSTISVMTAFETILEILNIAMLFNPMRIFLPVSFLSIIAGTIWGLPIILAGRGVSVGALAAIVVGAIFFCIGLIAEQLSAIRISHLDQKPMK